MGLKDARRLGLVEAAIKGQTSNADGARALGISRRQFIRLKARVRASGPKGLIHGNRGRESKRRLPKETQDQIMKMLQDEPVRLNDCHLSDLLLDEQGLGVCSESVRRIRLSLGICAKRPRRHPLHRRRRERMARKGELVQTDGSPFHWLGPDLPFFSLMGAIDDATGEVLSLTLRPQEDLHGYAVVFHQMFRDYGLPLAIYGDRIGILVRNDTHWSAEEELAGQQDPTQMGRVLLDLGIRYIAACSPQAKGRIERLWNTMQDRLAAELQRAKILALEAALAFLPGFIKRYNKRFAKAARETAVAWRKPPRNLEQVLSCRYSRIVARDNTVQIFGQCVQIPPGPYRRSWHGCRVELRELLDGRMCVFHREKLIATLPAPTGPFELLPRACARRKRENLMVKGSPLLPRLGQEKVPRPQPSSRSKEVPARRYVPPPSHAWRK